MNKLFKTAVLACGMLMIAPSAMAEDFVVPDAEIIVPIRGEAERLENMFEVTWGYYGLVENTGDDPMRATLTFPDGTVKTVNGTIADANKEGTLEGDVPTTEENALMFRNFMVLDQESMMYVQQIGTYRVHIPAGIVLVNGVPNPEANLSFVITGNGSEEKKLMREGEVIYPESEFTSFFSLVEVSWGGQKIKFADESDSQTVEARLADGSVIEGTATIQTVTDSGEDDKTETELCILYISFNDFLSFTDTSSVEVVLPEGLVENEEGYKNPVQSLTFYLLNQLAGVSNPEDGSTLSSKDATVVVSWEGLMLLENQGNIICKKIDGETETIVDIETVLDQYGPTITFDFTGMEDGTYSILIPEAYVLILVEETMTDEIYAMNSETYLTFTVSGSNGVESNPESEGKVKVYDINGMNVINDGNADALRTLSPGVYIVNGKKILINK